MLNYDRDAERRMARGDRKALCLPPQRRELPAANRHMFSKWNSYESALMHQRVREQCSLTL